MTKNLTTTRIFLLLEALQVWRLRREAETGTHRIKSAPPNTSLSTENDYHCANRIRWPWLTENTQPSGCHVSREVLPRKRELANDHAFRATADDFQSYRAPPTYSWQSVPTDYRTRLRILIAFFVGRPRASPWQCEASLLPTAGQNKSAYHTRSLR